ncbi:tetratricopeptide repeat protein [Cyanobium sp. Morenito 9A2]|uniref:tetratricopeptide repeat protein n=1 Tax=Cyanobium sp. Morenito 9A2 TaxID=2823718 RepID=UPI0020CF234D|nr:tetratricopeptide repeat protein [Cyanobium sp. Morenito 9A2]MCP9849481.1 glycosyltransferase [Cyanobium sp. Morenito 9A2]
MPAQRPPLQLVQVASFGDIGDNVYRSHQPAAAMARQSDVAVYEVHPLARQRDAAALAADVLVLTMTFDIEALRLIHQRHLLGRPTVCEINDYLPDVQPWNPVHRSWADPRARRLFEALMARSDATQVSTPALAQRLSGRAERLVVFENQLAALPLPRSPGAADSVVVGWGGSIGHLGDMEAVAPALCRWLQRQPRARLEIMGDPALGALFAAAPPERFRFLRAGSLQHYLDWLAGLDIGLAPLQPTAYNRCRSDVKWLEYASRGVVPVLQRLDPYGAVRDGVTGFLFDDDGAMVRHLDLLVADAALRQRTATAAYEQVSRERRLDNHVARRLSFYRTLARETRPLNAPAQAEPLLERLRQQVRPPLSSLPGWQAVGPQHWRMPLTCPAEHNLAAGVEALQAGAVAQAVHHCAEAARLDPSDAHAHALLGEGLRQLGRWEEARSALERSTQLDPLMSRPLRSLARLHHQAAAHYRGLAAERNPPLPPDESSRADLLRDEASWRGGSSGDDLE